MRISKFELRNSDLDHIGEGLFQAAEVEGAAQEQKQRGQGGDGGHRAGGGLILPPFAPRQGQGRTRSAGSERPGPDPGSCSAPAGRGGTSWIGFRREERCWSFWISDCEFRIWECGLWISQFEFEPLYAGCFSRSTAKGRRRYSKTSACMRSISKR